ncbi:noncanonical pyrimidine nucleotidase, YjjG family [Lysinibacillus fusiformis]|uniref:YjjG family noncanonical pyrimidine nucleotidase n=1 Tax=Lysinibacillus TaxID=400634 RepID=UPI000506F349|nr:MULTISPECIES: YjjG family noncanonical pyrimidine nucleotidase [Lysinibacillus]KAB0443802.1 noncanonical pyrimidine nucleotidase, YjjG family [Lysinibacillus fusiformis]KGA80872.1 HAD family hydrolase [Lysinibacillus fusiformis]MCT6818040.1 YjjG family noncanonical pyrimidine nucleotidase [Lysinibacillus fusiformis]MCT6927179.1 YjjG family noncanonical pyrimidine nucleotidase [Lysinibacillus fusiformis]MCT6931513.1 YjjG family noncanonical pyrimidine nucleotidase [Lysinibacillus fusiformis]
MTKYEILLFDVDDTLLDFDLAENAALDRMFKEENIVVTSEMIARYKEINESMWRAFERGEVTKNTLHNTRFSMALKEFGIEVDGTYFESLFQKYLREAHHYVDGAYEVIAQLANHYHLYVVSNGVTVTQNKRLVDANLAQYFKGIFISEQTGYQKPMPDFFDYVFERIDNFDKEKALIIGDSLTSDIKGGIQSGIDTCWFNIRNVENTSGIEPHYEIKKLQDLHDLLNQKVAL